MELEHVYRTTEIPFGRVSDRRGAAGGSLERRRSGMGRGPHRICLQCAGNLPGVVSGVAGVPEARLGGLGSQSLCDLGN